MVCGNVIKDETSKRDEIVDDIYPQSEKLIAPTSAKPATGDHLGNVIVN